MEIRMVLSDAAASYVKKLASERQTTNANAINRLILEVINQGGITIVDRVKPDDNDGPDL